ncbi:MAG TPA: CehA/McbA family metallohydrolase [Thermotogota bacterium]|nr:CehA/McbA family metallohydrolase [Thermotogota bacterium]
MKPVNGFIQAERVLKRGVDMRLIQNLDVSNRSTVVKTTVSVPERCRRITVNKRIEASVDNFFRNRIDISFFDDTGKWYGRFDRGKDTLVIDDESEIIGTIASGQWDVYFEVFQIFETVTIVLDFTFDYYDDYQTYTGELHTHTNLTDGQLSFDELSGCLTEKGYNFFFVSDHNSAAAWDGLDSLKAIRGYRALELTTFYGHILLLGLNGYVSWYRTDGTRKEMKEIREDVRSKGGLMGIAHPYTTGGFFYPGCGWENRIEPEVLDFVEIWNSKVENYNSNWEAINHWLNLLKSDVRIFGTCGADVHRYKDLEPALQMRVLSVKNDESSIIDAIRKGRFYMSRKTDLLLDAGGKVFGQTLSIKNTAEEPGKVNIVYRIDEMNEGTECFIISKSGMIPLNESSGTVNWATENERDFLVLIGIGPDKQLEIITNPIFIERE